MLIAHEKLRKFATVVFEHGGSEPAEARVVAVSYTHLTLPTILLV